MSYLTRCKTARSAQRLSHMRTRLTLLLTILITVLFTSLTAANDEPTTQPQFSKAYIDFDWGQIHLLQATPNLMTQRTLVCFPPNPFSGNYYRPLMALLAIDRRVVALDYPGLGQSDPSATWRTIGDLAEIMIDAIESARLADGHHQSIDVCGYHTGAMIAAEVAIRRPDLVRRVILIGVPYFADPAENDEELQNVMQDRPPPYGTRCTGELMAVYHDGPTSRRGAGAGLRQLSRICRRVAGAGAGLSGIARLCRR